VHNDYLNGLSDYGAVGMGLLLAGVLGGVLAARRSLRRPRGVGVGLGVLALSLLLDFHLQATAVLWLAALWAAAWLSGAPKKIPTETGQPVSSRVPWGMGVAFVGVVLPLMWAVPRYQAEELRWRARETLDELAGETDPAQIRQVADAAVTDLYGAIALAAESERAWMDLSYALSLQGFGVTDNQAELGREAEQAARQALLASEEVAEHWVRLGVALDLQGRWGEAGKAFGRAVSLAPRQPVVWYYQAFHFSLKPMTRELAKAALATCLRLDPWHDEAKLLKADLERAP
jgi:cytochrome c-type biogenesis protein CcmH/NrfG